MIRALDNIYKIQLFSTTAKKKLRACDVRKLTGADVVINCSFFDWGSWRPVTPTRAAGVTIYQSTDAYWGLAWQDGGDGLHVVNSMDMAAWDNFVSGNMLLRNGRKETIYAGSDVKRPAARTAVYAVGSKVSVWCDKTALTPYQLQEKLLSLGAVWALMLDGGGSSQLSQAGSQYVYSSRRVVNYLCFWCSRKPIDPEPETSKPRVEVNAYSLKLEGNECVSPHFQAWEFRCRDGSDPVFVAPSLTAVLEQIRAHFGHAVNITSGYRTPGHNAREGGKPYSQHLYGTAADIQVKGVSPAAVAAYARQIMPNYGGVGRYRTFTHVDVRQAVANWRG